MFTFGLGSGCDKNLVRNVAKAGRGTSTIVEDGSTDLNGQVIRALSNAMEPSLKGAKYGFNTDLSTDEEVFRNQMVYATKLGSAADFNQLSFTFKTDTDPITQQKIDLTFSKVDFQKVEGPAAEAIFKMAVHNELQRGGKEESAEIALSLKHQVICDKTAIVGVLKQENKTTGEVQESTIKFGKAEAMPE